MTQSKINSVCDPTAYLDISTDADEEFVEGRLTELKDKLHKVIITADAPELSEVAKSLCISIGQN